MGSLMSLGEVESEESSGPWIPLSGSSGCVGAFEGPLSTKGVLR